MVGSPGCSQHASCSTSTGRDRSASYALEIELMLACCRNPLLPLADNYVKQILRFDIDWEMLFELMSFHRVVQIVGRCLSLAGFSSVPAYFLQRVQDYHREATLRDLGQSAELMRILQVFHQHGVEALPFKGSVLSSYLYGDLSLRESSDIDLIVHEHDVLTIKTVLASEGYLPWSFLGPKPEMAFLRSACVYELHNPDKRLHLELHWKNSNHPSLPFPADFAWARQRETMLGARKIKTLAPEPLLLLLCAHGTKHSWRRMRYVCDVADTLRVAQNLDWNRVLSSAQDIGARRMVLIGLSLANQVLQAALPSAILREIENDSQVKRIVKQCSEEIFQSSLEDPGYWSILRFNLSSFDNWRSRLRYLRHMLLRPGSRDFQAAQLPRILFPLYPCIRLLRLALQFMNRTNPAAVGQ